MIIFVVYGRDGQWSMADLWTNSRRTTINTAALYQLICADDHRPPPHYSAGTIHIHYLIRLVPVDDPSHLAERLESAQITTSHVHLYIRCHAVSLHPNLTSLLASCSVSVVRC